MDKVHYEELVENLVKLEETGLLIGRNIYLFGHCNATEKLADLLTEHQYQVNAIFDNNAAKYGMKYKDIPILSPEEIIKADAERTIVCIAARAYAAMHRQLRRLGFQGMIQKLIDYNSYADYSLSEETIKEKQRRLKRGIGLLARTKEQYPDTFRLYCPFQALGDVYYMMSYLPYFLEEKKVGEYAVFTIGKACAEVAKLFGAEKVEVLTQRDMDELIQAVLYTNDSNAYIPHQDRPYVVKLHKALYVKKITLEEMYKYGVFGLKKECLPYKPVKLEQYGALEKIAEGKAVVLSPYAKSVTNISEKYWQQIAYHYGSKGYQILTNTVGEEQALPGTIRLEAKLSELQSIVERAGTFIGLRSGLCDVIKWANCRKIALYPDAYYSDTKWKMEEIYHLDGWENIVVREKYEKETKS